MGTRQLLQILPLNQGNNVYSFRSGIPQIQFSIPQCPKIMNGRSLRINGKLNVYLGEDLAGLPIRTANGQQLDVNANDGTSASIDCRTGISSLIDFCEIKNLTSNQTMEFNKNYNRMAKLVMPTSESFTQYTSGGMDATFAAAGKVKSQGRMCDRPISFSTPLLSGMLQGSGGLDLQLIGGILLSIQLQPPENACQNQFWHSVQTDPTAVHIAGSGPYYELTDVFLTVEVSMPDVAGRQAMLNNTNGSWDYDAYNSFYTTIANSDHSALLNINTSRTQAVICNMIPSSFLNNYNYPSGLSTQLLKPSAAGPNKLSDAVTMNFTTTTKGGVRIPLDMEVRSEKTQEENKPDSHKNYVELNTLREVWRLSNMYKSPRTELSLPYTDAVGAVNPPTFDYRNTRLNEQDQDAEQQYAVGVNYDHITDLGLDFRGTPVGIRFNTDMTAGNTTPHSVFLFVKCQKTIVLQGGRTTILE